MLLAIAALAAGWSPDRVDDTQGLVPLLLESDDHTVPRPDHSQVQLTYLGRDRVLAFNQWTGEHSLWQFERDGLSKCDALAWPPLSTGRWTALRYTEFTFAGFTQLISLDPRTGTLTLTECDEAAFLPRCRGEPLRCKPLFTHTLSGRGRGKGSHELTYLGSDLLLHYERATGRYELLTFTRCGGGASEADGGNATAMPVTGDGNATQPRCGIASSPVAHGSLPAGAYHSYLGGGYVMSYLPRAAGYELLKLDRPDASVAGELAYSLERVGGGPIDLSGSWSRDSRRHRLLPLHGGLMLDYDKESGEYRLLDLLTPSGVRSGLTQSSSLARAGALLFKTVSSSAIPRGAGGGCAAYTTSHSCLDASARMGGSCGWCQASGMCVRGDPWGPCRRSACEGAHAACGVWHSTSGVLGAVDSGQSVTAGAAIASTATMVESLDGGGATSATSAAAAAASSPNSTHPACTACAGGGMGLAGSGRGARIAPPAPLPSGAPPYPHLRADRGHHDVG